MKEGCFQRNSVKLLPLKLQNRFDGLEIVDTYGEVNTGSSTPINGTSPLENSAKTKASLVSHQINYFVTICYVKKFISKLRERIKPKKILYLNGLTES